MLLSLMSLKHMRKLIVLVVGLLAVGCGQSDVARLEEEKWTQEYETEFQMSEDENKRLKAEIESNKLKAELEAKNQKLKDDLLRLSVIGEYERKEDGDTLRGVLLANGKVKSYDGNGEKDKEGTWKLVGKEVYIEELDIEEVTDILKIEPNGNLTIIALIEDGKRTDFPKDSQMTLKKIK